MSAKTMPILPPLGHSPRKTTRVVTRRPHLAVLGLGLAAPVFGAYATQVRAVILPASTIDGPSENIVGFAMAEDGTGGLAYPSVEVQRAPVLQMA